MRVRYYENFPAKFFYDWLALVYRLAIFYLKSYVFCNIKQLFLYFSVFRFLHYSKRKALLVLYWVLKKVLINSHKLEKPIYKNWKLAKRNKQNKKIFTNSYTFIRMYWSVFHPHIITEVIDLWGAFNARSWKHFIQHSILMFKQLQVEDTNLNNEHCMKFRKVTNR